MLYASNLASLVGIIVIAFVSRDTRNEEIWMLVGLASAISGGLFLHKTGINIEGDSSGGRAD